MTPESQRIAIAEACGWRNQGKAKGVPALNHRWAKPDGRIYSGALPSYLTDLNAMHEAIRSRSIDEQWAIFAELANLVDAELPAYMGTPAQYAEAFLKTLGLWNKC